MFPCAFCDALTFAQTASGPPLAGCTLHPSGTTGKPSGREREAMIVRPVSPAEFAVRFGLEPVDVEWLMGAYRRGMSDDLLRSEIETLGCSAGATQQLIDLLASPRRR